MIEMSAAEVSITVCILTYNEADRLPRTLAALRGRIEPVVVLDAESDDTTRDVAEDAGCEVHVRTWQGYAAARRHLLELAQTDWVLMIDADEVVQPAFWDEVGALDLTAVETAGFDMRRRTVYLGRVLRRSWQPDWKTVLFRRDRARVHDSGVHESILIDGPVHRLRAEIHHHSYRSLADHHARIVRYASLGADELARQGRQVSWLDLTVRPAWAWVRQYLVMGGFVDGWRGRLAARSTALSVYLRYAMLLERHRSEANDAEGNDPGGDDRRRDGS